MGVAGNLLNASIFRKHRTPIVRQTEAAECGLACLAMIAGHHGHRIDLRRCGGTTTYRSRV